jgi:hypothetical protein
MITIMKNKQNLEQLLYHLVVDNEIDMDICCRTDHNENNMLYYAVQTKDINFLEFIFSSDFRDMYLFKVNRYEKLENIPFGASKKGLDEWKNIDGQTPRDLARSM